MRRIVVVFLLTLAVCQREACADDWSSIPLTPLPSIVATDFGALRMVPADALGPPAGTVGLSMTTSYFNTFRTSWHTRVYHGLLGLNRQPLTNKELDLIETTWPHDDIFHIHLEGLRSDFVASTTIVRGLVITARVPWIQIGAPNWDAVAEVVHRDLLGSHHGSRGLFRRGETTVYFHSGDVEIRRLDGLQGHGIGDSVLTVAMPLNSVGRLSIALKAPTGRSDTLFGSGGWSEGIGWSREIDLQRRRFAFAGSYSFDGGSFLGVRQANVFDFTAEAQQRIGAAWVARVAAHADTSNLNHVVHGRVGAPMFTFTGGFVRTLAKTRWVGIDLFEDAASGLANDWAIQIGFGGTLPRP